MNYLFCNHQQQPSIMENELLIKLIVWLLWQFWHVSNARVDSPSHANTHTFCTFIHPLLLSQLLPFDSNTQFFVLRRHKLGLFCMCYSQQASPVCRQEVTCVFESCGSPYQSATYILTDILQWPWGHRP